jgi:hypothetical protein
MTATGAAFAQGDDVTVAQARARFKEGVEFFDKGQYELARASFLQAYALKKHPDVLLNLAWSSLKSGHPVEAEKEFNQFLKEGKDISPAKRTDAEKGLTEAHAKVGHIEIVAAAGTDVTVDDNHVGSTPLTDPVSVEPGAHTVKFKGADGTGDSQSVSVLAGQTTSARFGGKVAAVTPPPTPPNNANATPSTDDSHATSPSGNSSSTSGEQNTPPPNADKGHKSNLFAPPANITPVVIGAVVTVAAFGGAIGMFLVKNNAQDKATSVAKQIHDHGGGPGTCVNPSSTFAAACSALNDDNNAVNTDALVGNIALGVGVVALIGTGAYYLFAPKADEATPPPSSGSAATLRPTLAPLLGPHVGGLSVSTAF